jgi:Terminase large subunit, T4likevirus-type, N-terminal
MTVDVAKKSRVKLYAPHQGQWRVHASCARFRVVAMGRRFGKTFLAVNELTKSALERKNTEYAWIEPWFRQAKIVYRLMRKVWHGIIAYKSDAELRIEFKNGSVLQFFSAENPDAIRGNGFDGVVIDEAGDALRNESVWFDAIRPTLSDRGGWALIIGTPKGRNLFFRMFTWGEDPEHPDWASFTAPTADNPYIPASEIEAAKRELPEDSFLQEYAAVFLEFGAGVFKGIDACINGVFDESYERIEGRPYVLGWDPAKFQDYSVLTLIDCHAMRVVGWWRFNHIDYTIQVETVATIASRFGAHVLMDVTGIGAPLYEQMQIQARKRGFSCEEFLFTNATKKALIESLQIGIQNRDIEFPNIPVLVNELRIFEYVLTKSGLLSYSAPSGANDDAVISLALGYQAASYPRGPLMWSPDPVSPEVAPPENRRYATLVIDDPEIAFEESEEMREW